MQSGTVTRLWVPCRGQKHGPGVKGASYAVSPTPALQGNSAPLPTALEHLDNPGMLKTQRALGCFSALPDPGAVISPVQDKSRMCREEW